MARKLSIRVGELFAEAYDSSNAIARWFLPKKPLADGLKEKTKLSDFDELTFELLYRPDALPTDRFTEKKMAAVVTAGFEGLLAQAFEQKSLPVSNDLIFGVAERIGPKGEISKTVDQAELSLISEKLKLMKITEVVVASLNSDLNKENQNAVASFFRDQGFKVFNSESSSAGEISRWTKLIEKVQWRHLVEDIEEQLTEISKSAKVSFKLIDELKHTSPTFYAGLDLFWLAGLEGTTVLLESQPNDVVEPGFFDAPEFTHLPAMQRSGPLLLGKSLRPTALDLFLLDDSSLEIDGLVAANFDRSRSRIEEALVIMSKGQQSQTRIEGAKVANDTLNIFVSALASELKNLAQSRVITVKGPLAKLVIKHLKQIDSTLKCELGADA